MIANMRLSTKFTLLLSIVFLGGLIASGLALWQALVWEAQQEITSRGLMLIETMRSVREYTNTRINPLLENSQIGNMDFIPDTVPAFSARKVFEIFHQHQNYSDFSYKEAALNPTNRQNKADNFESDLITQMRNNRSIDETSGYRMINNKRFFYIARPLLVTSQACLSCHSTPEVAPKNLIALYGSQNGFGWTLNDVNATQLIYVPADEIYNTALRFFLLIMSIFLTCFVVVILLINGLLKKYVIEPVSVLGRLAQKMKSDEMIAADLESEQTRKVTERADELGYLASAFRDMAHEVYIRTQNLKQQVQQLRVEIDEKKRQKDVAAIVESDFFKDLQSKAHGMRQRQRDAARRTLQLAQVDSKDDPADAQ